MEKNEKTHICYIFGILMVSIILLVTVKWSKVPSLTEMISFALTVCSLTLALLAIVHGIASNAGFTRNLQKMGDATQAVSQTASQINEKLRNVSQLQEQLDYISKLVKDSLDHIHGVPDQVSEITAEISHTSKTLEKDLSGVPERVNEILETLRASKRSLEQPLFPFLFKVDNIDERDVLPIEELEIEDNNPEKSVTRVELEFIRRCPLSGLLLLLLCGVAYQNRETFNISHLAHKSEVFQEDFTLGFLTAVSSLAYIRFTVTNDIYSIASFYRWKDFERILQDQIRLRLDEKVRELKTNQHPKIANYLSDVVNRALLHITLQFHQKPMS